MTAAVFALLAAISSSDAIAVLLNSRTSASASRYAEAKARVEEDARAGQPLQQFVIGVTTDDKALAERYLAASRGQIRLLAEKRDNPLAWYLLSLEKNDFAMLKRAADGGNVQALNALGTISVQTAQDSKALPDGRRSEILAESFGHFRKAALQRDANGLINLGTCYLRGLGCPKDMAKGFACFKAAAELGHPEGMDNMSACYQFGHGVGQDDELSLLWAMRGRALRGDEAAARWLRERK